MESPIARTLNFSLFKHYCNVYEVSVGCVNDESVAKVRDGMYFGLACLRGFYKLFHPD